jgi:hypothetical protein
MRGFFFPLIISEGTMYKPGQKKVYFKQLNLLSINKKEMGRAYDMYADRRGAYRVLVGKTEGKRPLGRPR